MNFDGVDDYIKIPAIPRNDSFSISAWIKTTSATDQQILAWGNRSTGHRVEFKTSGGMLTYRETDSQAGLPVVSNQQVNTGSWQHVAVVVSDDMAQLYINGTAGSQRNGIRRNVDVNTLTIGANQYGPDFLQPFSGGIDDAQIWNRALTEDEIREHMFYGLDGNETGLIAYWSFNDSTRSGGEIAGDYAQGGNHHGQIIGSQWRNESAPVGYRDLTDVDGEFQIGNLFYNESREFRVTPSKPDHLFDPEHRDIVLERGEGLSIAFNDTTVFTVSGQILFAGTACPVDGVEILLDGENTDIFTDAEGNFDIAVEEPGKIYTITPQYEDSISAHTFSPAEISVLVEGDIDGLLFNDTKKNLLYGKVRGGCIAGLGTARLRVASLQNPGCLDTTITTDHNGNYRVFFPAQEYSVDLVYIDNPDSTNILNYFATETVDITWENKSVYFVYHPKPLVRLEILPSEVTCDAIPIMQQNSQYSILIDVLEAYQTDTCHVAGGFVTIYDDIGGNPAEPVVIELENGRAIYKLIAGVPNILGGGQHPYQKLMQIEANVDDQITVLDQWALVTGHRPRTPTFTSATPELPMMILRDPPGDRSYSYQAKGSTIITRSSLEYESSRIGGLFADIRVGGIVSSPEVGASTSYGAYGIVLIQGQRGGTTEIDRQLGFGGNDSTNVFTTSFTANEEFRTADSDLYTGDEGDVFIGASLNQIFALTDIVEYDRTSCQVVRDTSLAMDFTGFNTTYIYTEMHIRNTVIPQLHELAAISTDSVDFFNIAIEVWQEALDKNDQLKQEAVKLRNISFSGGTQYEYSESTSKDSSFTIGYSQIIEREFVYGAGFVINAVPIELGYKSNFKWTLRETLLDSTNSQSKTFGYSLGDDDIGDFFSIDVKMDKRGYGTPVFDLVSGTSSCPWEDGTQPRDGPQLGIDTFVQNDVPPDEPATFILSLGNTSESGETRPYDLRVIQLSNPDGAVIKLGGAPMANALSYFIPAGDSAYQATLTVERGPRAFDYENLQIMMVPPCEYDLYDTPVPIADTVTFSVHFASPISDAGLSYPQDNWEISAGEPDSLPVVINDYNIHNDYLKSIKLQYRQPGEKWINAFSVTKDQLPDQNLTRYWNYKNLSDGEYELRVVSDGGANGVRYSQVAKGQIERNALLVLGVPEPADAVLNAGESIAIRFAAGINLDQLNIQRDISLIDATDSTSIGFNVVVQGNNLIIEPEISFTELGERTLIAWVSNISDADGNRLRQPVSWRFTVNQQAAYWKSFASEIRTYQGNQQIHTTTLYNSGSEPVEYQLVYLPEWLSMVSDNLMGTMAPGTEKLLTFRSKEDVPVGVTRDSVVVRLAGQEESRNIELNVLAAPPQWSSQEITAGAYMTEVYAQLLLNENISGDNLDFAGVFINDQLYGMGHVRFDELTGQHLAAFQVFYTAPVGGILEFRLWDASDAREYRYYSDDLVFQAGTSIGNRYHPLIIQPNEIYQAIDIKSGWNWISLNVAASDLSLKRILKDYNAQPGDLIKGQSGFSEYSDENGWTGTLDFLRLDAGYRLKSKNGNKLVTAGRPANSWATPGALTPGWNWIGYLPEKSLELDDALYFLKNVQGNIIKSHDQSAIYDNGEWVGKLREMHPGQSYSLYTQLSTELVYPDLKKQQQFSEKSDWTVDVHKYESNMTVTGVFTFDGSDYGDSSLIVAAFIDGECRGVTRPQYVPHLDSYIAFLMMYGATSENGASVQLKVYEPNTEITREVAESMVFNSDAHNGSLQEPLELNALQTEKERIPAVFYLQQNYPNPFNPLTTIEYGLPVDEDVTIAIYNVLGQKISVLVDGRQEAGRYKIQFDAGAIGMASGVYFYQIRTNAFVKSHKMLLLK